MFVFKSVNGRLITRLRSSLDNDNAICVVVIIVAGFGALFFCALMSNVLDWQMAKRDARERDVLVQQAALEQEMAPKVMLFALRHFEELDADADGTITDAEIVTASEQQDLSDDERRLLSFMRMHRAKFGHVVGSYTVSTSVSQGFTTQQGTRTVEVFGISRNDLQEASRYHPR